MNINNQRFGPHGGQGCPTQLSFTFDNKQHPIEMPEGDGWIWVASAAEILDRFANLSQVIAMGSRAKLHDVSRVDIELCAPANVDNHLRQIEHVMLYDYGFHLPFVFMGPSGYCGVGGYLCGYDIEGRGGAWVRRVTCHDVSDGVEQQEGCDEQ